MATDQGKGRWDYTLTVTWNGENITNGVLNISTSTSGDHVYRFYLVFGSVTRNHNQTITGKLNL